jgi:hypothetical protein
MPLAAANRARLQATAACAGALVLWWRFATPLTVALLVLAFALASIAWLSPRHYASVQHAFDFLTHTLLAALTWCVLALVYFGLFTPLRLGRAITGKDPLALRPPSRRSTYFRVTPRRDLNFDRQF